MRVSKLVLLGVCVAALGANAMATTVFTATLTGAGENPPNGSPGIGTGTFTLSSDNTMLTVDETFSGLTAPASAAHIHCCAGPGVNAPVVLPFAGFPSATSGTFDHTFNLTTDLTGISLSSFLAGLFSGTAYANIHDANFPGGEIRGQLTQAATPEPGTWGLMGLALAGLGVFRARRLRKS